MSITPESVQILLNSGDAGERMRAINQLRQIDKEIAFELIATAIKDENARIRYAAVSQMATLGEVDPNKALPILRDRLLNDTETDVQAAAADSLGALKLVAAFEDLQQLYFSNSNWLLRFSIVAALGKWGIAAVLIFWRMLSVVVKVLYKQWRSALWANCGTPAPSLYCCP
ncbi:HEAT repeat domain-containing protein [[Phormidium] sp. ETS-05]|uniref:HEAT repeat domain-containing protein n=1 Tax=[Phormidium] sp. ETS-05 TaxID=222819 RepID=UPI0031FEE669